MIPLVVFAVVFASILVSAAIVRQLYLSSRREIALSDELDRYETTLANVRAELREAQAALLRAEASLREAERDRDGAQHARDIVHEKMAEVLSENIRLRGRLVTDSATVVTRRYADPAEPLLTAEEASKMLGYSSARSLATLIARGRLSIAERGPNRARLFRRSDIMALAGSCQRVRRPVVPARAGSKEAR